MGSETSAIVGINLDDESGSLANISAQVNSITHDGGQELLEDTGMGDTRRTRVAGLANASTIQLNGYHNSTTRAIFGPLVDGTSITKTVELKYATGDVYTGEVWPEAVTGLSTNSGQLNTWSCNLSAQDGLSQTSVFTSA